MNNQYELSGKIIEISDQRRKEVGYGILKQRDLVLLVENPNDPVRNHFVKIQFTNDALDSLQGLEVGDMVQATVFFAGFGWDKEKDGRIVYINVVEGLGVYVF